MQKVDRDFACLLCKKGKDQFTTGNLTEIKTHLQEHLNCDEAKRDELVKGSIGKVGDTSHICFNNPTYAIHSKTIVFTLPEPDGREWLMEYRSTIDAPEY
jgi:hypothetical protein